MNFNTRRLSVHNVLPTTLMVENLPVYDLKKFSDFYWIDQNAILIKNRFSGG